MSDNRCFMDQGVLKCSEDVFKQIQSLSVKGAGPGMPFGATRIIVLSAAELDDLDAKLDAEQAARKAAP